MLAYYGIDKQVIDFPDLGLVDVGVDLCFIYKKKGRLKRITICK